MSSRNDYENLFLQHGISRNELCMMTDTEFQKTLQYFLDNPDTDTNNQYDNYASNSSSQYRYISPKLYAQRESQMRRPRREPIIQTAGGWEPAYQPSNQSSHSYQREEPTRQSNENSFEQQYPDYSQYQQFDEDEALQAALQASLQEHYQSMQNQEKEPEQENYHYQEEEQQQEPEPEPEPEVPSSSYSHVFKQTKKNERVPLNETQRLLDEQNRDYHKCVEEAFQKEMEENLAKHYEENQQQIEKEEQEQRMGEVVSKYYSLKPEPAQGTTIAVVINGQRYIRKFDPDSKAEDVYAWVAGQTIDEEDEDEKLYFYNFELQAPGTGVISPDETLAQQGIKGRVMLNVVML